jgi:LuxR family transcriptional regulator, maltose regulon positive regulatory protein
MVGGRDGVPQEEGVHLNETSTTANRAWDRASKSPGVVFLESKLHAPPVRREWVARRDLVDDLVASADKPMTLIDAPVGYGKTTLVSQWNAVDPRPFAWVTLDPVDNDPARFWSYVIEALRRVDPTVGGGTDAVPASKETLQHLLLPRLLGELSGSSKQIVLVLDDYHHIKNADCHELTLLLLDNLPATTQVVVSSRADPPLRVGRRRVEGSIFEVRAAELRFSYGEADSLLSQVLGRKLTREQVRRLADQTEGWPAGLYLAAVSLRDQSDPDGFIEEFTGSDRNVADYLTSEIVGRLPDNVRRFLLSTSILGRFSAPLCDEVVGSNESSAVIDDLERSNLMVVSLDEHRAWYRYHQLFGDLLRSELNRTHGTFVQELHRRACEWFRRANLVSEAVHHAIEARDRRAVRELISASWYPYLNAGRLETVRSWLSAVGDDEIATDPVLSLTAAWCSALVGDVDEAKRWVASARLGSVDGPLPDGARSLDSGITLLTAMFGLGGVSEAIDDARRALKLEPVPGYWRSVALTALGCYSYLSGDLETAQSALAEVVAPNHLNQPVLEIVARSELAMVSADRGDKKRARVLTQEARQMMEQHGLSGIPQASIVYLGLGRVAADDGDLHEARDLLEAGLKIRNLLPRLSPWVSLQMLLELAPVRFALGDQDGARELLREARAILAFNPDAGAFPEQLQRLERSLGRSSQRPALFGEPLTDRELAVLRLLTSKLTHREIANELFVSLNTVKSHVRAIYRKMNVTSRTGALNKARELELI